MKTGSLLRLSVAGTATAGLIILAATAASSSISPTATLSSALPASGPSTTTSPYVVPVAPGVSTTSLLTVNDAAAADNGYELVGIPDGIGTQWDNGKIVAYVNHELRNNVGIARHHGVKGAFQPASADQLDIFAWLPGPDLLRQ